MCTFDDYPTRPHTQQHRSLKVAVHNRVVIRFILIQRVDPGWICAECVAVHRQHAGLFAGHELLAEPPPRPFWEDLNFDKDVSAHAVAPITQLQLTSTSSLFPTQLQPQPDRCEVLTVDFNDPRLIKRDFKNWRKRMAAASKDEAVPVVSFVGPTGSGKSFLLSSLMDPQDRKHRGPRPPSPPCHQRLCIRVEDQPRLW